ncbi:MAG: hypothetical protein ACOYK6_05410 [Chthoniobacterales bacterium]
MLQALCSPRSKIVGYQIVDPIKIGIILLVLLICWTTKIALNFYHAQEDYIVLQKKVESLKNTLSQRDLQELQTAQANDLRCVENLSHELRHYKIILPSEQVSRTPEQFHEQLQRDILYLQEKAENQAITLPPSFCLGFSENEAMPSTEKEIANRSKQEFLLFWIVDHLCNYSHCNLLQFSFENKIRNLELIKVKQLGCLTLAIKTNETSFQKFFNEITNSTYYFVIEKIILENSNKNGPPHCLENKKDSIKIVLGREKLNIVMKIVFLDFDL